MNPTHEPKQSPLAILKSWLTSLRVQQLERARFTPRALKVLQLAEQEAHRLNHAFVDTEHLLLGLIRLDEGVACNVLKRIEIDFDSVRTTVEGLLANGLPGASDGKTTKSARLRKALSIACKEASVLDHQFVGTEHLLLGLLGLKDGVVTTAPQVKELDVDLVRLYILQELDPDFRASVTVDESELSGIPGALTNISPQLQRALTLAHAETRRLHHCSLQPTHLILGIIMLNEGAAATILRNARIDLAALRTGLESLLQKEPVATPTTEILYSLSTRKVLALAYRSAHRQRPSILSTGHVILNIVVPAGPISILFARLARPAPIDLFSYLWTATAVDKS